MNFAKNSLLTNTNISFWSCSYSFITEISTHYQETFIPNCFGTPTDLKTPKGEFQLAPINSAQQAFNELTMQSNKSMVHLTCTFQNYMVYPLITLFPRHLKQMPPSTCLYWGKCAVPEHLEQVLWCVLTTQRFTRISCPIWFLFYVGTK